LKAIALIPARLQASRFPRKLLADLAGKTVIRRSYEAAVATRLFSEVVVVTDSYEIEAEVCAAGGAVVRSTRDYESGTDRIAEAAATREADVFVNVQGDEPFIAADALRALLQLFREPSVCAGSLVRPIAEELASDPNVVKVLLDEQRRAIAFSRSPLPYRRDRDVPCTYYGHIGVYAFRKDMLAEFVSWNPTPLERIEKLECLRYLEMGVPIHIAVTDAETVGIDVPEDIPRALKFMQDRGLR